MLLSGLRLLIVGFSALAFCGLAEAADDMTGCRTQRDIAACDRVIAKKPRNLDQVHVWKGDALWTQEHPDAARAIEEYGKAIAINPRNAQAYLQRAAVWMNTGVLDKALSDLGEVITIGPPSDNAYAMHGLIHSMLGQYEPALKDLSKAKELNPKSFMAPYATCITYRLKNQPGDALRECTSAIDNNRRYGIESQKAGNELLSRTERAKVLIAQGDGAGAFEDLKRLPDNAANNNEAVWTTRARALLLMGKYGQALAEANAVLKSNPDWPDSLLIRARVYKALGMLAAARSDLEAYQSQMRSRQNDPVLSLRDKYSGAEQDLAALEQELGQPAQAPPTDEELAADDIAACRTKRDIAACDRAIARQPGNLDEVHVWKGEALRNQDAAKAMEEYDQAIVLNPRNARAYEGRADLLVDTGALDKAAADLGKVLAIEPTGYTYVNRATLYFMLEQYDLALGDLSKAKELDPNRPGPPYLMCIAYRLKNQLDDALRDCTSAIDNNHRYEPQNTGNEISYRAERARVLIARGDGSRAFEDLSDLPDIPARDGAEVRTTRARALRVMGKSDEALALLNDVVKTDPGWPYTLLDRALVYKALGRRAEASADLAAYRSQIRSRQNNPELNLRDKVFGAEQDLAALEQELGQPGTPPTATGGSANTTEARPATTADAADDIAACHRQRDIAACDRAIAKQPGNLDEVHVWKGDALRYQEHPDTAKAMEEYGKAIAINPRNARAYEGRAYTWGPGAADNAVADLGQVIAIAPTESSYLTRASLYLMQEQYDLALGDLSKAKQLDPRSPGLPSLMCTAYRLKNQLSDALRECTSALDNHHRHEPENTGNEVLYRTQRASVLIALGDGAAALQDLNDVPDSSVRDDADFLTTRARALRVTGKSDEALALLNNVLKTHPEWPYALLNRALVYKALGRLAEARSDLGAYQSLIRSRPDGPGLNLSDKILGAEQDLAALEQQLGQPGTPQTAAGSSTTTTQSRPAAAMAGATRRVALVIGESAYQSVPVLRNTTKDAKAVADALKADGFQSVVVASDLGRDKLMDALKSFAAQADSSDWAVVYYAGHGIEVAGQNYLIPVDARLASDRDVQFEAVTLDQVLSAAEGAKKIHIVILDACRDNPFANQMQRTAANRSIGRGLGRVEPEGGTLVVFAAKHGQVASDGDGQNSPFAEALVRRIATPQLEVRRLFDLVRDDVMEATGRRQQPFSYGSVPGSEEFYFSLAGK
jgi:tetratricopeptide (TPR) repeat protein